jgi:hypothetical protein
VNRAGETLNHSVQPPVIGGFQANHKADAVSKTENYIHGFRASHSDINDSLSLITREMTVERRIQLAASGLLVRPHLVTETSIDLSLSVSKGTVRGYD